jgi:hypothetical protein
MNKQTSPISNKKQLLVAEGLFIVPSSQSDETHLIGSRCETCGEVSFPKGVICPNCQSYVLEEILLDPKGKLYSFTNVNHPVPEAYKGPIPYGVGLIELPEGVRIVSYLTESDPEKLRVGMDMMLVIDKLFEDDERNEIIGFKFRPV